MVARPRARGSARRPRPSAFGGWPPTCSRASTSEVNSWPIGRPAKRTATSVPTRSDGEATACGRRRRRRAHGDLVGQRGDLVEQLARARRTWGRRRARRRARSGSRDLGEVGLELVRSRLASSMAGSVGVVRGGQVASPGRRWRARPGATAPESRRPPRGRPSRVRSCRRGRATGRGSPRPLPTRPGRPRPGARGRTGRP